MMVLSHAFGIRKYALIKKDGEYYEYDYDAVNNDPLFEEYTHFYRYGSRYGVFRVVSVPPE